MTSSAISNQGEGWSAGRSLPGTSLPLAQAQEVLMPLRAVQITTTLQTNPGRNVWCLHTEARNFDTNELLALTCDPAIRPTEHLGALEQAVALVRDLLVAYFDPDPF